MHEATITVSFVNQPRQAGGKKGSIKDSEGRYWSVWADKLGQFEVNKTYDIAYTSDTYQGKEYHTVKSATLRGAPVPQQAAPPPAGHNNPPNGNGHSHVNGHDKEKAIAIHVRANNITRLACALVGAGTPPDRAVDMAAAAYDAVLSPEIPY